MDFALYFITPRATNESHYGAPDSVSFNYIARQFKAQDYDNLGND